MQTYGGRLAAVLHSTGQCRPLEGDGRETLAAVLHSTSHPSADAAPVAIFSIPARCPRTSPNWPFLPSFGQVWAICCRYIRPRWPFSASQHAVLHSNIFINILVDIIIIARAVIQVHYLQERSYEQS